MAGGLLHIKEHHNTGSGREASSYQRHGDGVGAEGGPQEHHVVILILSNLSGDALRLKQRITPCSRLSVRCSSLTVLLVVLMALAQVQLIQKVTMQANMPSSSNGGASGSTVRR